MIESGRAVIFRRLTIAACSALVASACVAGAGASPSNTSAAPSPIPTPWTLGSFSAPLPPTAVIPAAPAGSGSPASEMPAESMSPTALSEADNGRTLSVSVGSTVTLVLHNTYWVVHASSDPSVLVMVGQPVYSGAGTMVCIPGAGCGTVTTSFMAVAPGSAVISASRTSCGEALMCVSGAGTFEVTVVVTR